jgi:hypothetical protein
MFLEARDEVGHELDGHDDSGSDRRLDDVVRFGVADLFFERGMTSQKVSVKSNGVWAIEQKLA